MFNQFRGSVKTLFACLRYCDTDAVYTGTPRFAATFCLILSLEYPNLIDQTEPYSTLTPYREANVLSVHTDGSVHPIGENFSNLFSLCRHCRSFLFHWDPYQNPFSCAPCYFGLCCPSINATMSTLTSADVFVHRQISLLNVICSNYLVSTT